MRRRDFISGLAGAAIVPLTARAQHGVRRVGVLMSVAPDDSDAQPVSQRCGRRWRNWVGLRAATYRSKCAGASAMSRACARMPQTWWR